MNPQLRNWAKRWLLPYAVAVGVAFPLGVSQAPYWAIAPVGLAVLTFALWWTTRPVKCDVCGVVIEGFMTHHKILRRITADEATKLALADPHVAVEFDSTYAEILMTLMSAAPADESATSPVSKGPFGV